ncbi:copper resistance protein CopC [Clavibacter michiganensis]|nr:copper resistance protein CopC [Clavibacter michiganensis]
MRHLRSLTSTIAAVILTAGLVATGASSATAHDVLLSSDPAPDSTVDGSLDTVTLNFAAAPLAGLESAITIQVTDASGTAVSDGTIDIDGATITTGVDLSAAGTYQLGWRSVSEDGHPISGTSAFTSTGTVAEATPTTSATPAPAPAASASASAAPADGDIDTSHSSDSAAENSTAIMLWILGGLAALFIIGLAVIAYIGRKNKASSAEASPRE